MTVVKTTIDRARADSRVKSTVKRTVVLTSIAPYVKRVLDGAAPASRHYREDAPHSKKEDSDMRTVLVRVGLMCACAVTLSGCGIETQDADGGEEAAESVSSALTSAQRSTAINNKAAANSAWVGAPTTAYSNTPSKPGGYRHYTNNASIYIGDAVGSAHIVVGLIRSKWSALGWENSALGFPKTDEAPTAFGTGQFNLFEKGRITWKSGAAQGFETHGCIDDIYSRLGWEWGTLGYATGDEAAITNRLKNNFERGRIYFKGTIAGSCANKTWPVLTTTSISNKLAAQNWPRITSLAVNTNQFGADVIVSGAGFTPGQTVDFYVNSPEFRHGMGSFTIAAADGTFAYSSVTSLDYVPNSDIKKINNVVTVQAVQHTSGKMAVSSAYNSVVGSNYVHPY